MQSKSVFVVGGVLNVGSVVCTWGCGYWVFFLGVASGGDGGCEVGRWGWLVGVAAYGCAGWL